MRNSLRHTALALAALCHCERATQQRHLPTHRYDCGVSELLPTNSAELAAARGALGRLPRLDGLLVRPASSVAHLDAIRLQPATEAAGHMSWDSTMDGGLCSGMGRLRLKQVS